MAFPTSIEKFHNKNTEWIIIKNYPFGMHCQSELTFIKQQSVLQAGGLHGVLQQH